jgi:tetraacyldisaccharide 4'-kinase
VLRWLWTSRRLDARLARLALLPAAGLYRLASSARHALRRDGITAAAPFPIIAVANLTVGDSGKFPVLIWLARHIAASGGKPGVALQDDGRARRAVLQHAVPGLAVAETPASGGATRTLEAAMSALLLETNLPVPGPAPTVTLAVIGAETGRAVRWPLPAGPWKEPLTSLASADAIIVTRKRAPVEAAMALADELGAGRRAPVAVAHLGMRHLEGLVSRTEHAASTLAGRRVVAASGSADPVGFISQVKATGAAVQVAQWEARDDLRDEDVAWLAHAARRADYVVVSEQDATRLRDRWPARVAEPLVAIMDLTWERNGEAIAAAVDAALASAPIS